MTSIVERTTIDMPSWEARFSTAPVTRKVFSLPTVEPADGAPSKVFAEPKKIRSHAKPIRKCPKADEHRWRQHGDRLICSPCGRTTRQAGLPPGTKIWNKAELRAKVAPKPCTLHDWRPRDEGGERRFGCAVCGELMPGKIYAR